MRRTLLIITFLTTCLFFIACDDPGWKPLGASTPTPTIHKTIQLTSSSFTIKDDGYIRVWGEIKNTSNVELSGVVLMATLKDKQDRYLSGFNIEVVPRILYPGDIGKFEGLSREPDPRVDRVKLNALASDSETLIFDK